MGVKNANGITGGVSEDSLILPTTGSENSQVSRIQNIVESRETTKTRRAGDTSLDDYGSKIIEKIIQGQHGNIVLFSSFDLLMVVVSPGGQEA